MQGKWIACHSKAPIDKKILIFRFCLSVHEIEYHVKSPSSHYVGTPNFVIFIVAHVT